MVSKEDKMRQRRLSKDFFFGERAYSYISLNPLVPQKIYFMSPSWQLAIPNDLINTEKNSEGIAL